MDDPLNNATPKRLSRLMSLDTGGQSLWREDELAGVLSLQLDAPLSYDLPLSVRGVTELEVTSTTSSSRELLVTFMDLLKHPRPPAQLLEWAKEFFKASGRSADRPLPEEVCRVLYFAVISLARARLALNISQMTDERIDKGVRWSLSKSWLDSRLRDILVNMSGGGGDGG